MSVNESSNIFLDEQPEPYTFESIQVDAKKLDDTFYRADVEFYGVEHKDISFECRIFINNDQATYKTKMNSNTGYAGIFYVFGHGGRCYGDEGHCEVPDKIRDYDLRRSHHLIPIYANATITDTLKEKILETTEIQITVVPILTEKNDLTNLKEFFKCKEMRLVVYN